MAFFIYRLLQSFIIPIQFPCGLSSLSKHFFTLVTSSKNYSLSTGREQERYQVLQALTLQCQVRQRTKRFNKQIKRWWGFIARRAAKIKWIITVEADKQGYSLTDWLNHRRCFYYYNIIHSTECVSYKKFIYL